MNTYLRRRSAALLIGLSAALLCTPLAARADSNIILSQGAVWQTKQPGQDTQGFITLHNTGDMADTLVSANCSIAAATLLVDGSGNPVPSLVIQPGQSISFSPTGLHLLLRAARYPVTLKSILPCAFSFAQEGDFLGYLNVAPRPQS